jgi:quercetin dioxygenase-like cupin family protein
VSADAGIVRVPLLDAALEQRHEIGNVRAARIELRPDQETGRHRHPCDVVGYVAVGTIRFQVEGEGERILRAGDAFHEPAGAPIAHFDNASKNEAATFIAFYLLPPGEDRLIEMLPSRDG